eukprot:6331301-Amphidinium_carterae.1
MARASKWGLFVRNLTSFPAIEGTVVMAENAAKLYLWRSGRVKIGEHTLAFTFLTHCNTVPTITVT